MLEQTRSRAGRESSQKLQHSVTRLSRPTNGISRWSRRRGCPSSWISWTAQKGTVVLGLFESRACWQLLSCIFQPDASSRERMARLDDERVDKAWDLRTSCRTRLSWVSSIRLSCVRIGCCQCRRDKSSAQSQFVAAGLPSPQTPHRLLSTDHPDAFPGSWARCTLPTSTLMWL